MPNLISKKPKPPLDHRIPQAEIQGFASEAEVEDFLGSPV
jgi:hypothetical protein